VWYESREGKNPLREGVENSLNYDRVICLDGMQAGMIGVTKYVDWQTLNPDNDYVLPHQRLWMFDVLVCPLSMTERFLSQPLVCGTVFHRTSLPPPLFPPSALVLNHISSFLYLFVTLL